MTKTIRILSFILSTLILLPTSTANAAELYSMPRFDDAVHNLPKPLKSDQFDTDFHDDEDTVLSVEDLRVSTLPGWPTRVLIEVVGEISSENWGELRLVPDTFAYPPKNGIYGFELVGKPYAYLNKSGGASTYQKTRYTNFLWLTPPKNLKGIQIRARRNEMEKMLSD